MIRGLILAAVTTVGIATVLLSCTTKEAIAPTPSVSTPIPPRIDQSEEPSSSSKKRVEKKATTTTSEDLNRVQDGVDELTTHTNELLSKLKKHRQDGNR